MEICPVDRRWFHDVFVEPHDQGCELINLAWKGEDCSLIPKQFSWQERAVFWIQGTCLLIPIIGTVYWIFWQTFGSPIKLTDPFNPEEPVERRHVRPIRPPVLRQAPVQGPPPEGHIRHPEAFVFDETYNGDFIYSTNWEIQHFPDRSVERQYCDAFNCTSIYGPDLKIKEFHHAREDRRFDIEQIDGNHLRVRYHNIGEPPYDRVLTMTENIPWIQHPMVGFRNFIRSDEEVMYFYGVMPTNPVLDHFPRLPNFLVTPPPLLMKVEARKVGIEEVEGFGPLQKVEVVSTWRWPYNSKKGELWFDETGQMRVFINPVAKMTGTFARNGLLPEAARP